MDNVDSEVLMILNKVTKANIEFNRNLTAKDGIGWNSLNHVYFILELESHFALEFNLVEISKLKNLGELTDLIRTMVKK